ncbi:MAG TPA: non-homologous end-joining DNA ligase [Polyangia bacterium]|nr:non-homologous end-joining DNA ligase [Polyangia bacterium]
MITHPDKVLFPDDGITKGELAAYYDAVAPVMVPHIAHRPVTMERFPAGIGAKGFIQKDVSKGFPEWLERIAVDGRDGRVVHYPLVGDARSLAWIVNQNTVTPHVWTSRAPKLDAPDLCVFDLDPSRDDAASLREGTLAVRALLDELGLPSFVKTSGSKGFHVVVPLDGSLDFDDVRRFAHGAGAVLAKRHPTLFTQEFIKSDRGERILIDTGRNGRGATFAAVYAVRPKPGAPVSAPCRWEEIERGTVDPRSFGLRDMAARLADVGDLWRDLDLRAASLQVPLATIEGLLTDDDWREAAAASTRRPKARSKNTRY